MNPIARWREKAQATITEQLVVERAKHVIAISPYVTAYYKNRLRAQIYDVPNAVAPTYFATRRQPVPGRVLFAGRVSRGKGIVDLVRAVSLVPECAQHVVIAGSSPDAEFERQLMAAIAQSGCPDRFQLTGLMPEESLLEEFSLAAVLVLPSYQETAPMVIQQAMAAGLPVVASRVGGIPSLLEHDVSGLLFEPGRVEELALQLLRVRNDPELRARLSSTAKRIATEKFSSDRVARDTVSAYRRMLDII
jgi:glycosyltransferase involved in cell wall biosynthesis